MEIDNSLQNITKSGKLTTVLELLDKCVVSKEYKLGEILAMELYKFFPCYEVGYKWGELCLYLKLYEKAYYIFEILIHYSGVDVDHIIRQQNQCVDFMPKYDKYIYNFSKKPYPYLTVTMTTCKRYDLFERTLNSFLNCCLDLELVEDWIVVDDNSTSEDRDRMKQKFPFITFYNKTEQQKGHANSMNILIELVKSPFVFHLEDDWEFIARKPYLSMCLEVLAENEHIGQCLVNKNYTELVTHPVVGGIPKYTKSNKLYYIHEYCPTEQDKVAFVAKYGGAPNCSYWAHYSLRPSLFRSSLWTELGNYSVTANHFELDYAHKYIQKYVSAFLPNVYCQHIGKCTWEGREEKPNAYVLNKEPQFVNSNPKPASAKYSTYIINLARRADRWNKIVNTINNKFNYERFDAVDGSKLVATEQLHRLFDNNNYAMRKGIVGCALSHIQLYFNLINSEQDYYIILEDDISFVDDYITKLTHLQNNLPIDWDLIYISYHARPRFNLDIIQNKVALPTVTKFNSDEAIQLSLGGTSGYLISKQGAKKLLQFINDRGMTNAIDTIQQKSADAINLYYCIPQLVYAECFDLNEKVDTDIQHDYDILQLSDQQRLNSLKKFYKTVQNSADITDNTIFSGSLEVMKKYPDCYYLVDSIIIPDRGRLIHKDNFTLDNIIVYEQNKPPEDVIVIKKPSDDMLSKLGLKQVNTKSKISLGQDIYVAEQFTVEFKYLFDRAVGVNFSNIIKYIKQAKQDVDKFVSDFCCPTQNKVQMSANKMVVYNKDGVGFNHDEINSIVAVYKQRTKNFLQALNQEHTYIYCCRFEKIIEQDAVELINYINTFNQNSKLVLINGLNSCNHPNIIIKSAPFDSKFHNDDWGYEKIKYDHEVFRKEVKNIIDQI